MSLNDNESTHFSIIPSGTQDFSSNQMIQRDYVEKVIKKVYSEFGAEPMETPMFELKDVLCSKYGDENEKLIFDLKSFDYTEADNARADNAKADYARADYALRYDLTVPLGRYLQTHGLSKLKRYQIGKVFRRDAASITQQRFREFTQCDVDFVGPCDIMLHDAQIIQIFQTVLKRLNIQNYTIRLNHRQVLNKLLVQSSIVDPSIQSIVCSSLDKLDKVSWEVVEQELKQKLEQKNIPLSVIEIIKKWKINIDDSNECKDLFILKQLLGSNWDDHIIIDPFLARGLDYYTGMIFEVGVQGKTIGGGGRYDNLMKTDLKFVGGSFGLERLISCINDFPPQKSNVDVFLTCLGKNPSLNLVQIALDVAQKLRNESIHVELSSTYCVPIKQAIGQVIQRNIPIMVLIGEQEYMNDKQIIVKFIKNNIQKTMSIKDACDAICYAIC